MNNAPLILKIIAAEYLGDMRLLLTFNNGCVKECDFTDLSKKGICTKLKDEEYFRNFTLDPFSVDWNNEIGFAPEYLFEHSI